MIEPPLNPWKGMSSGSILHLLKSIHTLFPTSVKQPAELKAKKEDQTLCQISACTSPAASDTPPVQCILLHTSLPPTQIWMTIREAVIYVLADFAR